ncbi:hypothetical protein [Rhodoferax sp.]|uniref:hypothetical protein n=1 Tax=Rhodoferax sp. TaxID=50421 RepID=UPI002743C486|nr:hypothetical protein [Rhodoferax sp.]
MITTQKDLRAAFWAAHPGFKRHPGWTQNQYPTDTRVAWCDHVEHLRRDGQINEALAQRATL